MGDERSEFAEFYRDSWAPCMRALSTSQPDQLLAEEQLAEAFARAWVSWNALSSHPAPRAWVVRTALNVGVSWWRRRRRETQFGTPAGGAAEPGRYQAEQPDAQQLGAVDELLMAAVRRLPAREREVVVLRLVLDLDTATTAKCLGIAPGTVRAHLYRAVAALRNEAGLVEAFAFAGPASLVETLEVSQCTTTK